MGAGMFLGDNQDVSHESGVGRMGSSICAALCCAPILIIAMCALLGYNERRAVCEYKALNAGEQAVHKMGCTDPKEMNGQLVYMNCDLKKDGLSPLSPGGAFNGLQFVGTGIKVSAEMYQCVEHEHSQTKKDKVGGGKTTVTTYTYSKEWKSEEVGNSFHKKSSSNYRQNCDADNPSWPSDLPRGGSKYAPKIKVGAVTTDSEDLISNVPLDSQLVDTAAPPGWQSSAGQYTSSKFRTRSDSRIGDVRVSFYGTNWDKPAVTLLGENKDGAIIEWTAPSAWLCKGFTVTGLLMGTQDKKQLFENLHAKSNTWTWILRLIGFLLMWFAFSICFGPLEVAADFIPCIGPMLGDSIACITCCVSCLPATACTLGVAGLVWCAMRPFIGIPMMILWCLVMGVCGYFVATRKKSGGAAEGGSLTESFAQNPAYGAAAPQAFAVAQAPRQFPVQVPDGVGPGQAVQVNSPEGTLMQVIVPDGVAPGGTFMAAY